jgi:dihydrofolate reductase
MGAGNTVDRGGHEVAQKVLAGMGGANLFGQYLEAGVIDEFTLTIAPVLLGSGKRLFGAALRPDLSFEQAGVIQSPFATHLHYRPAHERRNGGEIA